MQDPTPRPLTLADFHAAIQQRGGRWYGACLRITHDAGMAEDAVQEALLKAWDQRHSFRQDAELHTWVHRIALNVALDHVRKRRPESLDPDGLDTQHSTAPGPEAHAMQRAFGRDLHSALTQLTQRERESFLLKHVEGFSLADIAQRHQCSANNAKQTLFRAVQKLRTALTAWKGQT
jgi:RNA polymerase sigma-70 factor, ECF subfamily